MNRHPNFWGVCGRDIPPSRQSPVFDGSRDVWRFDAPCVLLTVANAHAFEVNAWHEPEAHRLRPSVFVNGTVYLGSDSEFRAETKVSPLRVAEAPEAILKLYEKHGTSAFALLDGEFNIVLFDPRTKELILVVDKFGTHDLYLRKSEQSILFASHPLAVLDEDARFDECALAFYLAHQGFIPSPFTLSTEVSAIGRSKFARIRLDEPVLRPVIERYWRPSGGWNIRSVAEARETLCSLLDDAVRVRRTDRTAVLLSGGIDSSLLINLCANGANRPVAITGSVRNWLHGEAEIAASKKLADTLGIRHEAVVLDPHDESLPEEYDLCATSWMSGARLVLPLWRRYARRMSDLCGDGYRVLAGQTADTLADNNYTLPSAGYTVRRLLFSSWFLRMFPFVSRVAPEPGSAFGKLVKKCARLGGGARIENMLASLLDGMSSRERFYAGRIFGYAEAPGCSAAYFPILTGNGFEAVTDWYVSNFVGPIAGRMTPDTFYRDMIELSMDMNMLHLDSRLLFHVYWMEGASAALPFMDARIVNFFGNLPYSARAVYREPKHIIRTQLRRPGMAFTGAPSAPLGKSQDDLLLEGTLGEHLRQVLKDLTFLNRAPGMFESIDNAFLEDQIALFRRNRDGFSAALISKVAALETWSRALAAIPSGKSLTAASS